MADLQTDKRGLNGERAANKRALADHLRTSPKKCGEFTIDEMREAAEALDYAERVIIRYPKPPAGHIVYFVGGVTGPVKIGWTQQPIKERLKCIQNGSPVKLHAPVCGWALPRLNSRLGSSCPSPTVRTSFAHGRKVAGLSAAPLKWRSS